MPYPTKPKGGWQRPRQVVVNKSTAQLRETKATKKLEQVPGNISHEYGAELQQPSGTVPLSRGWENVCIAARRNAEEHSVEPFVRENAKRLQGRGNRYTKDNDGQRPPGPHDDSAGVLAEGGRWSNAEMNNHEMMVELAAKNDQTQLLGM